MQQKETELKKKQQSVDEQLEMAVHELERISA